MNTNGVLIRSTNGSHSSNHVQPKRRWPRWADYAVAFGLLGFCAWSIIGNYYERQRDRDLSRLTNPQILQLLSEIPEAPDPIRDRLVNEQIKRLAKRNQEPPVVQPIPTPWQPPDHIELRPPGELEQEPEPELPDRP